MKVTLIHATPDAEDILIFTKQTRLEMKPELMAEIRSWPYSKKLEELAYMSKTIPSSWEFAGRNKGIHSPACQDANS